MSENGQALLYHNIGPGGGTVQSGSTLLCTGGKQMLQKSTNKENKVQTAVPTQKKDNIFDKQSKI